MGEESKGQGYFYYTSDFVANGDLCLIRYVITPKLRRKGLCKVEAWDWSIVEVPEGKYWPRKRDNYGLADKRALMNMAIGALRAAGEHELAAAVENERGQVEHRVYDNDMADD